MSRLIDADALLEHVWRDRLDSRERIADLVKFMPTTEERKKGKWTEKKVMYLDDLEAKDIITEWQSAKCDVCGKYHTTPYMYYFSDYEYCPNCGARMNGGEEND